VHSDLFAPLILSAFRWHTFVVVYTCTYTGGQHFERKDRCAAVRLWSRCNSDGDTARCLWNTNLHGARDDQRIRVL